MYKHLFPVAFMLNIFSMTGLLILLGLAGSPELAAEVGVVQGATVALFYAFSANARSLILSQKSSSSAADIMYVRLLLVIPLSVGAYFLSTAAMEVEQSVVMLLIARRVIEWLQEVRLSEDELKGRYDRAGKYVIYQSCLLFILGAWILCGFPHFQLALLIWALFPLVFDIRYILSLGARPATDIKKFSQKLLPHLGSSLIIGITVYVFRLLILLIVGKSLAGDLFTAFAIGGVFGSVFAQAFGPTLAFNEAKFGKKSLPPVLNLVLWGFALVGLFIFVLTSTNSPGIPSGFKSDYFFEALGLSMLGGVVMVYAQRVRFQLLHGDSEHDVFGPDVIVNILVIASIPLLAYSLGKESITSLYLISAILSFLFYNSSKNQERKHMTTRINTKARYASFLIPFLILFPVFFQLNHGVFDDPHIYFNSGGVLVNLPIPLSVLVCFLGIWLLSSYLRSYLSFGVIFLTLALMILVSIISTEGQLMQQKAKLILIIQYVLPMFGLVLGQMFGPLDNKHFPFSKAFLWVLVLIVPAQLLFSIFNGYKILSPYLGLFSIYQHLQYVPVMFISAFVISYFDLWSNPKYKTLLFIMASLLGIYVTASVSMLAIGLLFIGLSFFALFSLYKSRDGLPLLLLLVVLSISFGYFHLEKERLGFKFGFVKNKSHAAKIHEKEIQELEKIAPNLAQRFEYWKFYYSSITSNPETFLIGHATPPDRKQYPSAHNYYLDFIYNFGLIGLLPFVILIGLTSAKVLKNWRTLFESPRLLGLVMVVLFLIFIDNSLKVGLRQPFPGIYTFFLWGVLLTILSVSRKNVFDNR